MNAFLPTLANAFAVALGACAGLALAGIIAERFRSMLFHSIGLLTLVIGLRDAIQTASLPVLALSLIVGGLAGEALRIEDGMEWIAKWLKRHLGRGEDTNFVDGFVTSTILFCTGAMTLVGCFDAALQGNGELLYTKSVMDGAVAVFFAAAMGAGVLCSAGGVFIIQGVLTLLFLIVGSASALTAIGSETVIREVSAAGGAVIIGIGINLLGIKHIRIANLIPAMFLAGLLAWWFLAV